MAIDKAAALEDYKSRTAVAGDKWLREYTRAPDKLKAAIDGQGLYEAKMKDPTVLARRKKKLEKLSESDLNAGATAVGGGAYAAGAAAKSEKWAKEVSPFLDEVDRLKPTMPKRTADPIMNVARVTHFVKGLSELKKRLG